MLSDWEAESPGRTDVMFRALQNISPSQMADRALFDFEGLGRAARSSQPSDELE